MEPDDVTDTSKNMIIFTILVGSELVKANIIQAVTSACVTLKTS